MSDKQRDNDLKAKKPRLILACAKCGGEVVKINDVTFHVILPPIWHKPLIRSETARTSEKGK